MTNKFNFTHPPNQKKNNVKEIAIVGHPSVLGGADTELDHQIYCWQSMGIKIYICHTDRLDVNCKKMDMEKRGCEYINSRDWKSLKNFHFR